MSQPNAFFRIHLLLIPGMLALAAVFAHDSGLDRVLAGVFYDAAQGGFPAHASKILELLGHRLAKDAVTVIWLALLSATLSTHAWPRWQPAWTARRSVLWAGVFGMALGPLIVVGLKGLNSYHCPWDLVEFGGGAELTSNWFVSAAEAGHCFPGGHAASGFSLVALYFMARALEQVHLARVVLLLGVLAGTAFSLIRMAQGAHFLSHNLWAAAICWFCAALSFCVEDLQRRYLPQRAHPVNP
jgi:membrane-associated PAP2 superfamily phosphatase